MKKTKWTLILALMVVMSFSLYAQKPADLAGTWAGEATLEGEADPNVLTLVLKLEDGELSGHMTDQYDSMFEAPIEDITLEKGIFSFGVFAGMGSEQILIKFTMTLDGDAMKGKLEIPDMGMLGTWEATKQK
jgi:hypothetical protein